MSDPIAVSLKQPGDSLTFGVTHCALSERGKYPAVEYVGIDGAREVLVEMPKASSDRQLGRLGLTQETVVGKIVTISRGENAADAMKPFWNLAVVGTAPVSAPKTNGHAPVQQAPKATPVASPADDKLGAVFALHEKCFDHALKLATTQGPQALTLEAVSSLCAQVFIEAARRGIA